MTQTEGGGKRFLLRNLILHFRPTSVPEQTMKLTLSWGLGGMALVLVSLQIVTGVLLKFVYEPVPTHAYLSIIRMQQDVLFGQFIRNIHFWCANFLVIVLFLHTLRVFFTGAFHAPRQMTWILGLGLFILVLASNFTGYLLPWDQLAYWATTISIGMLEYIPGIGHWLENTIRGGPEMGPATLRIFFAIHTAVLPFVLVLLMAFHFWRIRKAGGLVIPTSPGEESEEHPLRQPTVPNLLLREAVVALVVIAFVFMFSVSFDASMGEPANPGFSPNPTKAPWYFAGIQEMLLHLDPSFAVFVVPVMIFLALLFMPYVNYGTLTRGVWFFSENGRRTAAVAAVVGAALMPLIIVLDEWVIDFAAWMPGLPVVVSNGVLPTLLALAAILVFYGVMKRRFDLTREEGIQTVFVFLVVSFLVLTITCIWFRGQGMGLMWPWQVP
ncbi:MAG: cytochrome b N-terminal domain-containing protein [Deltaproteobacteria bacterium]|nr:cytochrome b N-terminal domain-containing protein [Deltaproteobacteria bacterium]